MVTTHGVCELHVDVLKILNVFCETEGRILLLVTKSSPPKTRNAYLGPYTVNMVEIQQRFEDNLRLSLQNSIVPDSLISHHKILQSYVFNCLGNNGRTRQGTHRSAVL
jgi:hypothetical protein